MQAQQLFNIMKSHVVPATEPDEPLLSSPNTKKRPRDEPSSDAITYSETHKGQSASSTALETPVTKRKRGRPTKAETEARRAAEARGEILPKPKPYVPKTASPLVVGPDGQVKRRRGRPTKADTEARKALEKESKKRQQTEEVKQDEQEQPESQKKKESEQQPDDEDDEDDEDDDEE